MKNSDREHKLYMSNKYGHILIFSRYDSTDLFCIINFNNRDTNQFRIDRPGGIKKFITLDLVLFMNALKLYVIECNETNCF